MDRLAARRRPSNNGLLHLQFEKGVGST